MDRIEQVIQEFYWKAYNHEGNIVTDFKEQLDAFYAEPVDLAEPPNPYGKVLSDRQRHDGWGHCASAYRPIIQALQEQLQYEYEAKKILGEKIADLEGQVERLQKTCSNLIDFMARKGIDMEGESELSRLKQGGK